MKRPDASHFQFSLHGLAVDLRCEVPLLDLSIDRALGEFAVTGWPEGFAPIRGSIRPYEQSDVLRHLSPAATRVQPASPVLELYEERERFWLIDDRWGLTEINLLKGQWQSWILPEPSADAVRIVEQAIQWPLAQLLRRRGLTMIPAASVARGDFAMLLICPFGIEPELCALVRAGFKIIGQQWTALREEDGRVAMLHLPGLVERAAPPRLRSTSSDPHTSRCATGVAPRMGDAFSAWIDVTQEHCGASQNHAFVDAVVIIDRVRRPLPVLNPVALRGALPALRSAWPIIELHPQCRHGQIPARLAHLSAIFHCQLSRHPDDLLPMIDQMRGAAITRAA